MARRDLEQAVESFETALRLQPSATAVHYPLALAYRDLGRTEAMRAQLARVGEGKVRFADPLAEEVQRSVTGVGPHLAIGHIALRAGDLEGAAERFASALEADPGSAQAHHAMALVLERQGRSAEALAEIDRAAALAPREPELLRAAADAHLRAGNDWAAIELLRGAIELAPDYRTLLDLAMALERTGNLKEANDRYREASVAEPGEMLPIIRRALVFQRMGLGAEAAAELELVVAAEPRNAEALLRLAQLRESRGETAAAIASYRALLALELGVEVDRGVHLALGELLEPADPTAAAAHYGEAARLGPEHAELWLRQAHALLRAGLDREARGALEAGRERAADAGRADASARAGTGRQRGRHGSRRRAVTRARAGRVRARPRRRSRRDRGDESRRARTFSGGAGLATPHRRPARSGGSHLADGVDARSSRVLRSGKTLSRSVARRDDPATAPMNRGVVLFAVTGLTLCCRQSPRAEVDDSTAGVRVPSPPAIFAEVTDEVGLRFTTRSGAQGGYHMPEVMGGGGAVFDYDGDGDLDVYLIAGGERVPIDGSPLESFNRLFRHEADGSFSDVTASSGLTGHGYGMGCAVGDIDNDHDLDLYVTNWGPDALYRNEGTGRFTDISASSGALGPAWSASAAFLDYDRDGRLDLYVTRYVEFDPERECADESGRREYCGPTAFPGVSDLLYHNAGDGRFEDVSRAAGITTVEDAGLGVVTADFDDDGWLDVYVANDADPNNLWINQRDGTFVDDAVVLGAAYNLHGLAEAGMGVVTGDADDDGDLDLFVTHLIRETNTLYRNQGVAGFEDATAAVGLGSASLDFTGFGTAFLDYDNDGDLDLAAVNGGVKRRPRPLLPVPGAFWNDYAEPNLLWENRDGRFVDACAEAGPFCSVLEVSRSLIAADFEEDGGIDLLVTSLDAPTRIYRNQRPGDDWIEIRAEQRDLEREAHGSRITCDSGGRRRVRHLLPGGGYLSASHSRARFGLGGAGDAVCEIRWPDGTRERLPAVEAGTVIEWRGPF